MPYSAAFDSATSRFLSWRSAVASHDESNTGDDAALETDEPPDQIKPQSPISDRFRKAPIRQISREHQESLLTKALHTPLEEESLHDLTTVLPLRRRRSLTSNISHTSTADFTSDTGITTPARTSSPSPRMPDAEFTPSARGQSDIHKTTLTLVASPPTPEVTTPASVSDANGAGLTKKRCISFACTAKPARNDTEAMPPPPPKPAPASPKAKTTQAAPKRTCIKFACATRPTENALSRGECDRETQSDAAKTAATPPDRARLIKKHRSPSATRARGPRSTTPRLSFSNPFVHTKKYLVADAVDLERESSRFHEFASEEPQEDDWIRQDQTASRRKLTIDDTLKKELAIRRLGKEAEDEVEQEEDEKDDVVVAQDDDEEGAEDEEEEEDEEDARDDEDDEDADSEDDELEFAIDDEDASEGYDTDNEVGFASSDDEDDDLVLWSVRGGHSDATPVYRRPSYGAYSDSSDASEGHQRRARPTTRQAPIRFRPRTPELPDSTDFVCGTLDEDRPLEDAYMSCLAARHREKHTLIPQDIDPSFPTSDPEDEGDEEPARNARRDSGEPVWHQGELEGLEHEPRRGAARKQTDHSRRYRSPPPPKARGKSPRRIFDRQSPAKRSKTPSRVTSAAASPVPRFGSIAHKTLAFRPGLTQTKSLPRPPSLFPQMKTHRKGKAHHCPKQTQHVRGAIDIVKGLEQKRQRRREKYMQKYCNRARKGHVHEKKPQRGQGAERMKELGLMMAGKRDQGNYVLSC